MSFSGDNFDGMGTALVLSRGVHVKRLTFVIVVMLAAGPLLAQNSEVTLAGLIEAGRREAALERIRAGEDVNQPQPDGTLPIHWAVYRVDYELLEALISCR